MSAIQCPSCGHRHFQPVAECINCGEPLAAFYDSEDPDEEVSLAEPPSPNGEEDEDGVAEYERFLAESRRENAERLRISASPSSGSSARKSRGTGLRIPKEPQPERVPPPPQRELQQDEPVDGGASSRQLVRRQSSQLAPRARQEIQPYEIYETALDIVPPETFSQQRTRIEQELRVDPERWRTDKLPWYFPKVKPKVAGVVVLLEAKEEIIDYPDLFAAIATLLVEFVWVIAQVEQQTREGDRVVMTTVRLRTFDGTLKDSRVRGNMRGSNISLGDEISLWGPRRHGVVQVRRGFNHTTQATISTHSLGLIIPAILVIVCIVAGVFFAPYWFPAFGHWFVSSMGALFHLFIQLSTHKDG